VEYRVATDLSAEESQTEPAAEGATPTAAVEPPPPTAPTPQPAQGGAEVIKRLNAMAADIKAALAGPNKVRVQALFVSVNGLIKNKDFIAAGTALDELDLLVAKPSAAPAAAPPPPPVPANDAALAAEWERRMVAIEPR